MIHKQCPSYWCLFDYSYDSIDRIFPMCELLYLSDRFLFMVSSCSGPTISIPSIKEETTPSVKKRALKYLNELFRRCLEEVKNHYLLSATNNKLKVYTATPFLKAVDPVKFPDYAQVNLSMISSMIYIDPQYELCALNAAI